jgi:hypothetical protein
MMNRLISDKGEKMRVLAKMEVRLSEVYWYSQRVCWPVPFRRSCPANFLQWSPGSWSQKDEEEANAQLEHISRVRVQTASRCFKGKNRSIGVMHISSNIFLKKLTNSIALLWPFWGINSGSKCDEKAAGDLLAGPNYLFK